MKLNICMSCSTFFSNLRQHNQHTVYSPSPAVAKVSPEIVQIENSGFYVNDTKFTATCNAPSSVFAVGLL